MNSKPPVEPSPGIGGGLKGRIVASGMEKSWPRTLAMMALTSSAGSLRSDQSVSLAIRKPELGRTDPASSE